MFRSFQYVDKLEEIDAVIQQLRLVVLVVTVVLLLVMPLVVLLAGTQ